VHPFDVIYVLVCFAGDALITSGVFLYENGAGWFPARGVRTVARMT